MDIRAQGYPVFTWQEFESRIRGGQNSYRLRISDVPKNAPAAAADVLLNMNSGATEKHLPLLRKDGIVLSELSVKGRKEIVISFSDVSEEAFGKKYMPTPLP